MSVSTLSSAARYSVSAVIFFLQNFFNKMKRIMTTTMIIKTPRIIFDERENSPKPIFWSGTSDGVGVAGGIV